MKQSNAVRRLWCAAWFGFVIFIYLTVYARLSQLIVEMQRDIPLISTASMYAALGLLGMMIISPPYSGLPSQKATTFYVVGALVIGLGLGLFGTIIPLILVVYGN